MQNALSISGPMWWAIAATCLAIPLLIHLIQLYRHQKIRWAAMTFLLRSQKRSRRWIRLKQWLLIASRMALLLLGWIVLSQSRCDQPTFQKYLGTGVVTQHLILLDDSYSMEETAGGISAKQRSLDAIQQLLGQLQQENNQRVSLATFSSAVLPEAPLDQSNNDRSENGFIDPIPLVQDQVISEAFNAQLASQLEALPAYFHSWGPTAAIDWAVRTMDRDPAQSYVVHLVSDFRDNQWADDQPAWQQLKKFTDRPASWNLVDCSGTGQAVPNLSLADLKIVGNLNTTRTGFQVEVVVENHGSAPATNVVVELEAWNHPQDEQLLQENATLPLADSSTATWQRAELPAVLFQQIPPGQRASQSISLSFSTEGWPVLLATLPEDALPGDNMRQLAFPARDQIALLVLDDQLSQGSWLFSQSLNPAGLTGIECQIDTSTILRRLSQEELNSIRAIVLLDIPRLEEASIEKLKRYVSQGGGLFWIVGPAADPSFYNGPLLQSGLFPVALERAIRTPQRLEGDPADLVPVPHPVFQPFLEGDQSQLDAVVFDWIWKVDSASLSAANSPVQNLQILATFREKDLWPLFLEHQLPQDAPETTGRAGRILTFLNTADGQWNNWPQELTFPAMVLLACDHIAQPPPTTSQLIGESPQLGSETADDWQATVSSLLKFGPWTAGSTSTLLEPSLVAGQGGSGAAADAGPARGFLRQSYWPYFAPPGGTTENILENKLSLYGPAPAVWDWLSAGTPHRTVNNPDLREAHLTHSSMSPVSTLPSDRVNYMRWNQLQWQAGSLSSLHWLRPFVIGLLILMVAEAMLALWTTNGT